jgi:hypothetical protein
LQNTNWSNNVKTEIIRSSPPTLSLDSKQRQLQPDRESNFSLNAHSHNNDHQTTFQKTTNEMQQNSKSLTRHDQNHNLPLSIKCETTDADQSVNHAHQTRMRGISNSPHTKSMQQTSNAPNQIDKAEFFHNQSNAHQPDLSPLHPQSIQALTESSNVDESSDVAIESSISKVSSKVDSDDSPLAALINSTSQSHSPVQPIQPLCRSSSSPAIGTNASIHHDSDSDSSPQHPLLLNSNMNCKVDEQAKLPSIETDCKSNIAQHQHETLAKPKPAKAAHRSKLRLLFDTIRHELEPSSDLFASKKIDSSTSSSLKSGLMIIIVRMSI